jgi:hypothetical protein
MFKSPYLHLTGALLLLCSTAQADILVDLDATALPNGALTTWTNNGTVTGNFVREVNTPQVTTISGVKGVTLDGDNDWYVGPAAPVSVTGNGSRSIEAWVYNPAAASEETVFAWGRRGGGDGTNMSFGHGTHDAFGAVGHWGNGPDVGWDAVQTNNDDPVGGDDQEETGIWSFIAYTYDGSTTSVYTNGQLTRADVNGPLNTHAVSTSNQPLPFVVGNQNEADGTRANAITGSLTIARLRVHDRALPAVEVAGNFNEAAAFFGRAPFASVPVISSFTSSSAQIFAGDSVMLFWTVSGADSVSIDQGVTIGNGQTSVSVSPSVTTTYTLTATNAEGASQATVIVNVDPGVPVANDGSVMTVLNTPVLVTLTGSDPNTPAGNLVYSIVTSPGSGGLTGSSPNLTYTPNAGFFGIDSFAFQISDGQNVSNIATVSVTVTAAPSPPTGISASSTTISNRADVGSFLARLQSADINFTDTHSYQLVAGSGDSNNGLFSIVGNQLISQNDFSGAVGNTFSIRIRTTDSGGRTFEQILVLSVVADPLNIVINEVHFDPAENSRTEFVELFNPTPATVSLAGWKLANGIDYTFPGGTNIAAGGYLVIAEDPALLLATYGVTALGPFTGGLSGEADDVELLDAVAQRIDRVNYKAEFPWPIASSGDGPSMELIHPELDNDLGSSWRAAQPPGSLPELTLLVSEDTGWSWRPGTTEASNPVTAWRQGNFTEDRTWTPNAQASIGYGTVNGVTRRTTITGMQGIYTTVFLRNEFTIAPGEVPQKLRVRYTLDDGMVLWINGFPITKKNLNNFENAISATAEIALEGEWYDETFANAAGFLTAGVNTVAVQLVNQSLASSDLGFDIEIIRPASVDVAGQPTPGAQNSVYSTTAPPNIRQVDHSPSQPIGDQLTVISAKVSDPQGVGSVALQYQIVAAGSFIPSKFPRTVAQILADADGARPVNPAFEAAANWTTVAMLDDGSGDDATAGDGVFTATIPGQAHRTLVRYRITVADIPATSVRVPYADDDSLNFGYFVYDGVPDFVAGTASVNAGGAGHIWPKELLTSIPVYHWLIRNQDMLTLQAYNGSEQFTNNGTDAELAARRAYDWEGAFVYNGKVYDHVRSRLRGGNSRYGDFDGRFPRGKRHYKFRFNAGNHFQAHDEKGRPYETKWRIFNVGRMFGTKGGNSWGLPEEVGNTLWEKFGVPAQRAHWFHFRVIDGAAEAPDQYNGDFWGISQAQERYDVRFLESRNLPKGNLYKLSDWMFDAERQRRYQSSDMVRDGSEFDNIWHNVHGNQTEAWLKDNVNYEKWYRYSAVAEAIRHYDIFPWIDTTRHGLKNLVWYFEPTGSDPTRGLCWFLPYDWDASFGPNFNNGWEHAKNAVYGHERLGMLYIDKPNMKIEHRNVLREFRDLVWQPDQFNALLDDRAAVISELSMADQDRWRSAPVLSGTANDDPLTFKVQDMKDFAFTGWSGGSGENVGAGGRGAHLDTIADGPDAGQLPATPTISYAGAPNNPTDSIVLQATAFSDPQGSATFGGMAWRIGEIEDPTAPAYDPADDFLMEIDPVWESGVLPTFANQISVPGSTLRVGHTYRARVRVQDTTGRWSHWSAPYEFTTTEPAILGDLQSNLMITEVMYHPSNPTTAELNAGFLSDGDFEYIELKNISATLSLNLIDVRFTKGIDFDFSAGTVTTLAPGGYVLVVKNLAAFEFRYGTGLPVAGEWDFTNSLSNAGEQIKLSHGAGTAVHDFVYDDNSPWPVAADGDGPSMALVDPGAAPDHGTAGNWRASYSNFGSPGTDDVFDFNVWMVNNGVSDPNATFGASGLSAVLAYALGADISNNFELPSGGVSNGYLSLQFSRRIGASDIEYDVERSLDLLMWDGGTAVTEMVGAPVDNGDGTETLVFRSETLVQGETREFLRLKVRIMAP